MCNMQRLLGFFRPTAANDSSCCILATHTLLSHTHRVCMFSCHFTCPPSVFVVYPSAQLCALVWQCLALCEGKFIMCVCVCMCHMLVACGSLPAPDSADFRLSTSIHINIIIPGNKLHYPLLVTTKSFAIKSIQFTFAMLDMQTIYRIYICSM